MRTKIVKYFAALGTILLGLFTLLVFYAYLSEQDRLVQQCMHDGKKEYECRAIIYPKEIVVWSIK